MVSMGFELDNGILPFKETNNFQFNYVRNPLVHIDWKSSDGIGFLTYEIR